MQQNLRALSAPTPHRPAPVGVLMMLLVAKAIQSGMVWWKKQKELKLKAFFFKREQLIQCSSNQSFHTPFRTGINSHPGWPHQHPWKHLSTVWAAAYLIVRCPHNPRLLLKCHTVNILNILNGAATSQTNLPAQRLQCWTNNIPCEPGSLYGRRRRIGRVWPFYLDLSSRAVSMFMTDLKTTNPNAIL